MSAEDAEERGELRNTFVRLGPRRAAKNIFFLSAEDAEGRGELRYILCPQRLGGGGALGNEGLEGRVEGLYVS